MYVKSNIYSHRNMVPLDTKNKASPCFPIWTEGALFGDRPLMRKHNANGKDRRYPLAYCVRFPRYILGGSRNAPVLVEPVRREKTQNKGAVAIDSVSRRCDLCASIRIYTYCVGRTREGSKA